MARVLATIAWTALAVFSACSYLLCGTYLLTSPFTLSLSTLHQISTGKAISEIAPLPHLQRMASTITQYLWGRSQSDVNRDQAILGRTFIQTRYFPSRWHTSLEDPQRWFPSIVWKVYVYSSQAPRPALRTVYVQECVESSKTIVFKPILFSSVQNPRAQYLNLQWRCFLSLNVCTDGGTYIPEYIVLVKGSDKLHFTTVGLPDFYLSAPDSISGGWDPRFKLYDSVASSPPVQAQTTVQSSIPQCILVSSFFFPSPDTIQWEPSKTQELLAAYRMKISPAALSAKQSKFCPEGLVPIYAVGRDFKIQRVSGTATSSQSDVPSFVYTEAECDAYFPYQDQWPAKVVYDNQSSRGTTLDILSCRPPPYILLARKADVLYVSQTFRKQLVSLVYLRDGLFQELRDCWTNRRDALQPVAAPNPVPPQSHKAALPSPKKPAIYVPRNNVG